MKKNEVNQRKEKQNAENRVDDSLTVLPVSFSWSLSVWAHWVATGEEVRRDSQTDSHTAPWANCIASNTRPSETESVCECVYRGLSC